MAYTSTGVQNGNTKQHKLLQFKEHMNSHTKEISYFCPVCNQQSSGTKNLGCHTKQVMKAKIQKLPVEYFTFFQVHKLTLCQAEVLHKTNRFGGPMSEEQIEDMKHKMTSLKTFNIPAQSFVSEER